jgi:hypothetical protein
LQATVAEVITDGSIESLEQYLDIDELPDPEAEPAPNDNPEPAESRWKTDRKEWEWEEEARSFTSKGKVLFPEANYTQFKEMSPSDLFDLFLDKDILELIAIRSCEYAMAQHGMAVSISSDDIRVFFAILILSGYNKVTDYKLYWSNSEDTENRLVKGAMSRNRFLLIKRCFHMGNNAELENDRFRKVRPLAHHLLNKFTEMYVPEQELSHDEAMIKYFGKNGLKQAIRNKPIRFGYKVWVLATVSGYVVTFDLYQGKGIGTYTTQNVKTVGAAAASVLDLLDLLPEEKLNLPYHLYADNFFSSHKLIEVLGEHNIQYTGTIRQDRVKGSPPITSVDKFRKKERGHHETVVLADKSQIVTRWNDNAPVTLISSCHGDQPLGTAKRYNRKEKKYLDIPQPFVVNQYNKFMLGVDRFDQNNNHVRISVGGKKWYWPAVTWLVDTGVHNAWQLHRKGGGMMTLLQFKRDLVCSILREAASTRSRISSGSTGPIGARPGGDLRYDGMHHFVKKRDSRAVCNMEACKAKVVTYCGKCNRAVCIDHFEEYHTKL